VRFLFDFAAYRRRPISRAESCARIAERLRARQALFLHKLKKDVFDNGSSPYLALMRHARCEYGDLEDGVTRDGIEPTLRLLMRNGVYLKSGEFKGREPLERGRLRVAAGPDRLRSPQSAYQLTIFSSGSRGEPTPVLMDLRFVRDCGGAWQLLLEAWGENGWRIADWETPGAGARFRLMKYIGAGKSADAWFSQVDPDGDGTPGIVRWNTRMLRWAGRLTGNPIPMPVHTPLQNPQPILDWFARTVREKRIPLAQTFASSAVALCRMALEKGIDISGGRLLVMGEPITRSRVETIRKAQCVPIPRYGSIETGPIGYGCPMGRHPDDVHLMADHHAVIQAGDDGPAGLPPEALLVTSLHPNSPFTMLNLSMGDQGVIEEARCGCLLESVGWTTHLRDIRSFEKLTSCGVTFLGTEVIQVLEEVLPKRFGGAPTDFQLVENEMEDGRAVLTLVVNPSLGALDDRVIADEFLSAISAGSAVGAVNAQIWRDGGTVRIERRFPTVGRSGKILHFSTAQKQE